MGSVLSIDLLAPSVVAVLENNDYITSRGVTLDYKRNTHPARCNRNMPCASQLRRSMRAKRPPEDMFLILIADSVLQHEM